MPLFGLIGNPLSHSLSAEYFQRKFQKENIADCEYRLFALPDITLLPALLERYPILKGLNVTIPYKKAVMSFLDEIDREAALIGAVNTVQIKNGKLKGYNTDAYGFEQSLLPLLKVNCQQALVLGTGGAAQSVIYILKKHHIPYQTVSHSENGDLSYRELTTDKIQECTLIINATPLGMGTHIEEYPALPYQALSSKQLLYDLVYNPLQTVFLRKGREQAARIKNGREMFALQAEKSWEIWNDD